MGLCCFIWDLESDLVDPDPTQLILIGICWILPTFYLWPLASWPNGHNGGLFDGIVLNFEKKKQITIHDSCKTIKLQWVINENPWNNNQNFYNIGKTKKRLESSCKHLDSLECYRLLDCCGGLSCIIGWHNGHNVCSNKLTETLPLH